LSKAKGIDVQQVIHLLKIANNNLPEIEWRYERLQSEVTALEFEKQQSCIALSHFKSQIEKQNQALNSLHISCERERREIENLYNEKARLQTVVTGFKSNNEVYLNKIKKAAYEEMKSVLTNGKFLLQFATACDRYRESHVYSSCRRNHGPVSFRPFGARSSHWYIPQSASRPRA
jgi:hypothetical protein